MTERTRSRGVTAAAIVALLGAVCTAGFGVLMLVTAVGMNQPEAREAMARGPAPPFSPGAMMIVMGVTGLAFAVWGCASAVAVMRLKRWGRTSFLVFSGLLVTAGAINAFSAVMIGTVSTITPLDPKVPSSMLAWIAGAMLMVSLAIGAIGLWWLILFNRARVKTQFTSPDASQPVRQGLPIRVHVMAWMLVSSVLSIPFVLFRSGPIPAFLFGYEVSGPLAPVVLVVQGAVAVATGIGLLRRHPGAHTLAVGVAVFGLINSAALAARPGGFRRVVESYRPPAEPQLFPPEFFDSTLTFVMIVSVIVSVTLLALLISARAAYLRACVDPTALPLA